MYRNSILILITVVSLIVVMSLPLYLKFSIYPAYEELLVKNVEKEMKVLAREMIKGHQFMEPITEETILPQKFIDSIENISRVIGLPKVKIFTNAGIIVYSTDPTDLGNKTSKSFFSEMLVDGIPRSEIKVFKDSLQSSEIHLIETYIPIYENTVPVGAFEIYHNITGLKRTFDRMVKDERRVLLPVVLLLLIASLASSWLAYKSMAELKRTRDRFQELSVTDNLTGLLNRRGFSTLFEMQLAILSRSLKGAFLLYIDLDEFKQINDNFGHDAGDQALIDAAQILRTTLRISDVIGRIGGDEFAALTIDNEGIEEEGDIRGRLLENVSLWNSVNKVGYTLSLSIGIIEITPDNKLGIDELINLADEKMYAEKQNKNDKSNLI